MADQVTLMASGGLSASRMRLPLNFLPCGPGRPVVSSMKGTRLMWGISVEFNLFGYFGHVSWSGVGCGNKGRVAREKSNNGDIQVRD